MDGPRTTSAAHGAGARPARLKRRSEFLRAAGRGRKHAAPGLVLQALIRPTGEDGAPDAGPPRVGFTASRKVGNAVARNRARRRLKAAADAVLPARARAGTDYVLIARAGTLTRPYMDLVGDLETALARVERAPDERRGRRGGRPGRAGGKRTGSERETAGR